MKRGEGEGGEAIKGISKLSRPSSQLPIPFITTHDECGVTAAVSQSRIQIRNPHSSFVDPFLPPSHFTLARGGESISDRGCHLRLNHATYPLFSRARLIIFLRGRKCPGKTSAFFLDGHHHHHHLVSPAPPPESRRLIIGSV